MKKSTKCLWILMLLLILSANMRAADVYLLTAEMVNGTVGKYEVPSNHQMLPNTAYGSNVYSLKITSMPETGFSFRIGVTGWGSQMQPYANNDPLTINEEGTQNAVSYYISNKCYGSDNAWRVSYTNGEYEYLTVNVDITEGETIRRVWIDGKKKGSGGGNSPVDSSEINAAPGYYLVGNFFSPYNIGGEYNPGGDGSTISYTKHLYFKFEQQKDGSYTYNIPACLTAHAQILAVNEDGTKKVYGPGAIYDLHGAKNEAGAWPLTNGTVGTIGETPTEGCLKLLGSTTIAEGTNYWNLVTRNDGQTDDDGMYTFTFTLDESGNPSDWQVKHDAKTRVAYLLSNMDGATAHPLYNTRENNTGGYSNNTEASLYFNGTNSYWGIGYVVNDVNSSEQHEQAIKATPNLHATQSLSNNSGTHEKLFFLGNGGNDYNSSSQYRDKVWANQKPFTLNLHGIKRIQYNPNRGDNELVKQDGSYGTSGSIYVNGSTADFLINTMSMIGDAVNGTIDEDSKNWIYTSTAGDMNYDANERCFSLTLSTLGEKYSTSYFRFVANHDTKQNWAETDDNLSNNTGFARTVYDADEDEHHSCMAGDANDVQFRITAREDETTNESGTLYKKDILWNRPEGIWTVRFYPELDKNGNDISRYTISGTKIIKMPFTYRVGKFLRTYSNNVAMAPVDDNVKVYEAYKYEKPEKVENRYSQGKIYLRQLKYVPANTGVVLIGEVPANGTFTDGEKLNFSLKEGPSDVLSEQDDYKALWANTDSYAGDEWNNYLVPTVKAVPNLGNAAEDANGNITHRFFGLGNFHSTNYYKQMQTGDDYIGFFRFTADGRSGANKAYLSIPANATVDDGVGAKFGYIDYNGQFIGDETDTDNQSLAKMTIIFDDEENEGGVTDIEDVDLTAADGAYYSVMGIKTDRPLKGVYIHNGKKIVIR